MADLEFGGRGKMLERVQTSAAAQHLPDGGRRQVSEVICRNGFERTLHSVKNGGSVVKSLRKF